MAFCESQAVLMKLTPLNLPGWLEGETAPSSLLLLLQEGEQRKEIHCPFFNPKLSAVSSAEILMTGLMSSLTAGRV